MTTIDRDFKNIVSDIDRDLTDLTKLKLGSVGSKDSEAGKKRAKKIEELSIKIHDLTVRMSQKPLIGRLWGRLGSGQDSLELAAAEIHERTNDYAKQLSGNLHVQEAEQLYLLSMELNPKGKECRHNLAHCLFLEGKIDEALAQYEKLAQNFRREPRYARMAAAIKTFSEPLHLLSDLSQLQDKPPRIPIHTVMTLIMLLILETVEKDSRTQKAAPDSLSIFPCSSSISKAKEFLGKLIFIADRYPEKVRGLLNLKEMAKTDPLAQPQDLFKLRSEADKSVKNLEAWFIRDVEASAKSISRHWVQHQASDLQDVDLAVSQFVPIEIAKLIVTSIGQLNLGVIKDVERYLIHPEKHWLAFEKDIHRVLKAFSEIPELREKLAAVKKPAYKALYSNEIIRTTLRLPPDQSLTDHDAQVVALAGLMSHWRQQSIGSCFVSSFAIQQLNDSLLDCLEDFTELIREGSLKREIGGKAQRFLAIPHMSDEVLSEMISMNQQGIMFDPGRKTLRGCL